MSSDVLTARTLTNYASGVRRLPRLLADLTSTSRRNGGGVWGGFAMKEPFFTFTAILENRLQE